MAARPFDIRRGDTLNDAATVLTIADIYISQRRFDEAESLLREALRNMRAMAYDEGIGQAELQMARIQLDRGEFEGVARLAARLTQDYQRIGQPRYALEAALLQSDALRGAGDPSGAMDALKPVQAAVAEFGYLRARIARSVGLTFADLGQFAEAETEIEIGLSAAREQHLRYDEALLLMARCEVAALRGLPARSDDVASYRSLLEGLGVRTTPSRASSLNTA